jgi:hypothetical protein
MRSLSIATNLHRPASQSAWNRSDFAALHRFTSLMREEDLVRRRPWWTGRSRRTRANPWKYLGILAFLFFFVAILRASGS